MTTVTLPSLPQNKPNISASELLAQGYKFTVTGWESPPSAIPNNPKDWGNVLRCRAVDLGLPIDPGSDPASAITILLNKVTSIAVEQDRLSRPATPATDFEKATALLVTARGFLETDKKRHEAVHDTTGHNKQRYKMGEFNALIDREELFSEIEKFLARHANVAVKALT